MTASHKFVRTFPGRLMALGLRPLVLSMVTVMTALAVSCGGSKSKTTHSDSGKFPSLAEKKEALERYVSFRRTYHTLDFRIDFRDGGDGGVPSPSEWNLRLAGTIPPDEIDQWTSGLASTATPDTSWVADIPNAPTDLKGFEWHTDKYRIVGIDRTRNRLVYQNRTH